MSSRSAALSLYKNLLRESQKFSSYNFRSYAIRRVKDAFKEGRAESDPEKISRFLESGKQNLEVIKRQTLIGNLYSSDKLVIEKSA